MKKEIIAPLSGGFMIMSIVGFVLSLYMVYPLDMTWGTTFMVVCVIMFIASMISMTYSDVEDILKLERK